MYMHSRQILASGYEPMKVEGKYNTDFLRVLLYRLPVLSLVGGGLQDSWATLQFSSVSAAFRSTGAPGATE